MVSYINFLLKFNCYFDGRYIRVAVFPNVPVGPGQPCAGEDRMYFTLFIIIELLLLKLLTKPVH